MIGRFNPGPNEDAERGIYIGDSYDLLRELPDDSIDMILTDPPYPEQYLWTYNVLGVEGERVLKPGGWLFAYGGTEFIPQVAAAFGECGLSYYTMHVLKNSGGWPRLWNKKLLCGYKVIWSYTKGSPSIRRWMGNITSDEMDKRYHEWGQGVGFPMKVIAMLTEPGDTILDPLMGGGTTAVAAAELGRRYIGFEINSIHADTARKRVSASRLPLFIPTQDEAEQAELFTHNS